MKRANKKTPGYTRRCPELLVKVGQVSGDGKGRRLQGSLLQRPLERCDNQTRMDQKPFATMNPNYKCERRCVRGGPALTFL